MSLLTIPIIATLTGAFTVRATSRATPCAENRATNRAKLCRAACCVSLVAVSLPPWTAGSSFSVKREKAKTVMRGIAAQESPQDRGAGQAPEAGERPQTSAHAGKPQEERGYAAFYSQSLAGHKTACGGVYSSSELTAAHPSYRCGTKLRITNLRNGKTVRVTVNDHGPASRNRIVDVSYAAAQALDFVKQGTTLVKIEVVR